MNVLMPAVLF